MSALTPTPPSLNRPPYRWVGDRAVLVEAPHSSLEAANSAALQLYQRLTGLALAEVEDVIPGARTVFVLLRPGLEPGDELHHELERWAEQEATPAPGGSGGTASPGVPEGSGAPGDASISMPESGEGTALESAVLEVPVRYGGSDGPDLEAVAAAHSLSIHRAIELHSGALYSVGFIGFSPGFPYLLGLPDQLVTPRLSTPRTRVPAGSVAIGGEFTGIYPRATPGGWRLIGRTELELFDPRRDPPSLLRPGDRVRFVPR